MQSNSILQSSSSNFIFNVFLLDCLQKFNKCFAFSFLSLWVFYINTASSTYWLWLLQTEGVGIEQECILQKQEFIRIY